MQNKKLIISLFSLCLVAIVGLLATVIVFAATSQEIKSGITINYTATEVAGTLTGSYKVGSTSSTETKSVTFTATTDASTIGNLNFTNSPDLSAANKTVVYTYTFKNDSSTSAKMTLSTTLQTNGTNITIKYGKSEADMSLSTPPTDVVVAENEEKSIYVQITIDNTAKNVDLTGSFNIVITNTVEQGA